MDRNHLDSVFFTSFIFPPPAHRICDGLAQDFATSKGALQRQQMVDQ